MNRLFFFLLVIFVFQVSACSPISTPLQEEVASPQAVAPTKVAAPTSEPTELPVPSETPPAAPAFDGTLYQDEAAGFEFDYPAGWTVDGGERQSRGYFVQFYSWDWKPGDAIEPLPEGGTVLSVTVQLWDPKHDLEAFINQRKMAWEGSGISVQSEERLTLAGGRPAAEFIVQASDGAQAYFLLTANGEDYLVLSGNGDLNRLAEIAHTLRPIQ